MFNKYYRLIAPSILESDVYKLVEALKRYYLYYDEWHSLTLSKLVAILSTMACIASNILMKYMKVRLNTIHLQSWFHMLGLEHCLLIFLIPAKSSKFVCMNYF